MAELSIPYAKGRVARPSAGGRGGGLSAVPQPRVPDVSGAFEPLRHLAGALGGVDDVIVATLAQRQKAKDVAALTAAESDFAIELGRKRDEIETRSGADPFDYGTLLQSARDELLGERKQTLAGRLHGAFEAKAKNSTDSMIIQFNHAGAVQGVKQALTSLDMYEEQMSAKMLLESNENQFNAQRQQLAEKYKEYVGAGLLTEQGALQRGYKLEQKMLEAQVSIDAINDGKGTFERLKAGEYPRLAPETRVKMLDKAQAERREAAEWQDNEDRRAEKQLDAQQEINASHYREQIYKMGGGPGALKLLADGLNNRDIGGRQHDNLMSFAIRLQSERASQAASAASRAASLSAREEIARRRADENTIGMLEGQLIANVPGPDGQLLTPQSIIEMGLAKKLTGVVVGETARRMDARARMIEGDTRDGIKEQFNMALKSSEAAFEQQGLSPTKDRLVQQSFALFQERLMSMVFRDKADPFEARDRILNEHLGAAATALEDRYKPILATLPEAYRPTRGESIEPQKAQLANDFKTGVIPEGEYRRIGRLLKELEVYPAFKRPAKKAGETPAPAAPEAAGPGMWQGFKEMFKWTTPEGEGRR
jgi:hypothetical protein